MNRKKTFLKNFIILMFGNVIPKLVSVVSLPIITGRLSKSEFGTYDLVTTALTLLLPIVTLELHFASFRFLMDDIDKKQSDTIVSNVILPILPLVVISDVVIFFVLYKYDLIIRILVCAYYTLDIYLRIVQQIVRGFHKNKLYSGVVAVNAIVNLVMIVVTVYWKNMGMIGALVSLCVSDIVALIVVVIKSEILSTVHVSFISMDILRKMLQYSIPLIPNAVSAWILAASDRLVLKIFIGIEATAIYAAATKIPTLLNMLQRSFAQAWQENASIANKDDDKELYYSEMFDVTFSMIAGLLAILIVGTPIMFKLLIRGDYKVAYIHIPLLLMGCFFACIASYIEGIYIAIKETKSVGITTAVCAAVNIVIDLLLVRSMGIFAASLSTLVAYFMIAVYRMIDILRFQKIRYKVWKICMYTVFLCAMCGLCMFENSLLNIINGFAGIVFLIVSNGKTGLKFAKNIMKKRVG